MNFCKRSYQPILRYIYTETIKRGGEISLHKHFKYGKKPKLSLSPQNRDYNKSLAQVYNVAPLLHCACCSKHLANLLAKKMATEIVTRL